MNSQSAGENSSQLSTTAATTDDDPSVKEILWPPHGHVFQQEFMLPAYCKPKLIPLKSVTLEKLEKMQAENAEKLRNLELQEMELEQQQQKQQEAKNGLQHGNNAPNSAGVSGPDIWKAEE